MLQFETLLLRQLQKQQNRDEFCDTVLHTQGVSVPVHSCVLSAFSPRLYGTLSSMPVPMVGQRRLIELHAVDACTLLSLVSLLYSGQFHENREQVLSAAQALGIDLSQWQEEEESHGEKTGKRKESKDAARENENEMIPRNWDNGMTRRIEESRGREEKIIKESGTQTEYGRETNESGAQIGLACSEPRSIQAVYLTDQATYSTNQELGSYMDIQETVSALHVVHPESESTACEVLAKAPETGARHTNGPPRRGRSRGRPRLRPRPPASRGFSTTTPTKQDTVDPRELDLLHTVTPIPAAQMEPIQPIDTLLNDIMTDLHLLPPAENQAGQHRASSPPPVSKAMYPNNNSVIKHTDPKQHLEGELNDILDQFLRTFDQHVASEVLDEAEETSQDKLDAGRNKSGPSMYPQLQPQSTHLRRQKPQANLLDTSSIQPLFASTLNPSVAENTSAQDGHRHGTKVEKPSKDQNFVQQFENRRMTRSQSMKRKLETALISLQNPVKRTCKKTVEDRKTRQRDNRGRYEACANKKGVNNLDKNNNNRTKRACREERQRQASARERSRGVAGFGRKDALYGTKKSSETKKNVGEAWVDAEQRSNDFQAGQSSAKKQIGGSCIEIASSAMEKVRMLLQLQDEEEDARANESMEMHRANKVGNGRWVDYKSVGGAKERIPVENRFQGHLGEIPVPENEEGILVSGEVERQERTSSIEERSKRQEDDARMADGLRQEEPMTEEWAVSLQPNVPSNTAKEGITASEATLGAPESVTNVLDSCLGDALSARGVHSLQSEVVPTSTQITKRKTADLTSDVGAASAARLSLPQPRQERFSPHGSTNDVQELTVDEEDDDVDVLEVSSLTSELPAVSTVILGVADPSTEEEEEVEDDVEIDVLGLEPD